MESVPLAASKLCDFDPKECVICQQPSKEKLLSVANGCKRIREASEIRNDIVTKRLKVISSEFKFFYHMSNQCYKTYTNSNLLRRIQKSVKINQPSGEYECPHGFATRSHSALRSPPNPKNLLRVNCIICDKMSYKKDAKKYRISESNRAISFLEAANFFQDDVFSRVCDLQDEHAVFGADLYYHKQCMTNYLQRFQLLNQSAVKQPEPKQKQRAWDDILPELEDGLKRGNGYELSAVRDKLNRLVDDEHEFRNRDVKIYFLKQFGKSIDFTYPSVQHKSPMVYSALNVKTDDLAERIRSMDPLQACASVLRESLESHDFDLDDRFGDAQDLKFACSNMKIPEPVIKFFGHLYNFNPDTYQKAAEAVMSVADPSSENFNEDEADETSNNDCEHKSNNALTVQRCRKIQTLFQTMFYVYHCGRKRTPMHIMIAEGAHSLGRGGKIFTTILNHQGLSLSYSELRRYQHDIATYTAQQNSQSVALPAHFDPGEFTSAAFDNWDHEGSNASEHDTVCVLFQDKPMFPRLKPERSNTFVEHGPRAFKEVLPCQILQDFQMPSKKPDLPTSFKGSDELYTSYIYEESEKKRLTDIAWSIARLNLDVNDNQVASIIYPPSQCMPSWSAANAIWTDENVPLKQVAFLPVLPYPVTSYAAVYTQMKNLVMVCSQLVQDKLPIYADEKVYCMAKEIQLFRPVEFNSLVLCLGTFHTTKTLLKCIGKSLKGSGAESVWLEAGVYGSTVIQNSILNGGHYNRSLDAQKLLAESMQRLLYKEFFVENGVTRYSDVLEILGQLKSNTASRIIQESKDLLSDFKATASKLINDLKDFIDLRCSTNENFKFWYQFLKRHEITLDLLRADREGSWQLHLDAMQRALYEFAAWDSTNYLRWGSVYLEDARHLSETAPSVFRNFSEGRSFSIKDKPGHFSAVGGDQKLEQTINLSSKCSDGVIGHAKQKQYVAQWDMIYHEMMAIKSLHREYTGVTEATSEAWHHHESSQSTTTRKEGNIQAMMKFIEERGSPFSAESPKVLHNFVTKEVMTEESRKHVLNASEKGKEKYEIFHCERFINKTMKLHDTIHRLNLKTMITIRNKPTKTTKKVIRAINMTEKSIEVARDRGLTTEDLLMYDVVPSPMLFDDEGLMTKPEKSQLIRELEERLTSNDYCYHHKPKSAFLIDVMAAVRRMPLTGFKNFCDLLSHFTQMTSIYHQYGRCDYIFDIYSETPSVKDSERLRRCNVTPVVLSAVEMTTPLPKDMATFWPSNKNKQQLEKLIYSQFCANAAQNYGEPTVLGQVCMNSSDWKCIKIHNGKEHDMPHLQSMVEEADLHIPVHVFDCVRTGYKTCVVLSNDTDVIISLLHFMPIFLQEGLEELWVRAGRGTTARFVPLHILFTHLDQDLCSVLPALHSLTGCDITSKIGTKKGALKGNPTVYLKGFGTTIPVTSQMIHQAEQYLVRVIDVKSSASNFQGLREEQFHFSKSSSLQNLPPTSHGLKPHIYRAFYNAYTIMHALDSQINKQIEYLDPLNYGFMLESENLVPSTTWKTLEDRWSVVCHCGKCARVTCPCQAAMVKCSVFCTCKKKDNCKNPYT